MYCKDNVAAQVAEYLQRFPHEGVGLQSLMSQLDQPGDAVFDRATMLGHLTASMVILDASLQKVLLIHHKVYDRWLSPGGHYEAPGSLWDTACREVAEETGLTELSPWAGGAPGEGLLLDIDTHPIPARPAKNEGPHWHHDFTFVAVADGAFTPVAQEAEVHGVAWRPLAELDGSDYDRNRRLARKVRSLVAK